jgi:hypothetical protein
MDDESYRRAYFTDPPPQSRFSFVGVSGVSLYIEEYDRALGFYGAVLGPPAYVEGSLTHGWPIGNGWLTLFPARQGGPANMDVTIAVETAEDVADLYEAFIAAGATGEPPSDQLMYEPVRYASITDPFGTIIVIISRLQ